MSPTCPATAMRLCAREIKKSWQDFCGSTFPRATRRGSCLSSTAARPEGTGRGAARALRPTGRPVLILATKSDKLNVADNARRSRAPGAVEGAHPGHASGSTVLTFSATRHLGIEGADEILAKLAGLDADTGANVNAAPPAGGQPVGGADQDDRRAKKRPRDQGEGRGAWKNARHR